MAADTTTARRPPQPPTVPKERTKEDQEREMQANIDLIRKAAR